MRQNAQYAVFLGFGLLWVVMGAVGVIALLKSDNQPIRFGKWGLVVTVPIVVPLIAAFAIAAFLSARS